VPVHGVKAGNAKRLSEGFMRQRKESSAASKKFKVADSMSATFSFNFNATSTNQNYGKIFINIYRNSCCRKYRSIV
jgi:hypothetical protein